LVVLFFMCYVFACLFAEVVSLDRAANEELSKMFPDRLPDPEEEDSGFDLVYNDTKTHTAALAKYYVDRNFNSFRVVLLTMVQFTTKDIGMFFLPIMKQRPASSFIFLFGYAVISIYLMNLVTAALVEGAVSRGRMDEGLRHRQLRKQVSKFVPEFKDVFNLLDTEDVGEISVDVLFSLNIDECGLDLHEQVKEILRPEALEDSYDCFDADSSGWISQDEFVDSCMAVLISGTPEITRLLQLVRINSVIQLNIENKLERLEKQAARLEDQRARRTRHSDRMPSLDSLRSLSSGVESAPSRPNSPFAWRTPMLPMRVARSAMFDLTESTALK